MIIRANECIFPLSEASVHASSFLFTKDGRVFAVWFQGSAEGNPDVCIWSAQRAGGRWSEPVRLTADDGVPHWNPVPHLFPDGRICVFYKKGIDPGCWRTEVIESSDGGLTFGPARELVPGDRSGGRGPVRNRIITLSDGSLLAPGSIEYDGWRCFADRSADGGATWQRSADVSIPSADLRPSVPAGERRRGLIQPAFFEDPRRPGRVVAFMRSTEGFIYKSESHDFGRTFCEPRATSMKNNNSAIDIDLSPDGRLFLACNPCGVPDGKIWGKRSPLSLFVSDDYGENFRSVTDIETGAGTFAYPCVRFSCGRVYLTYTWNRKLIRFFCLEL